MGHTPQVVEGKFIKVFLLRFWELVSRIEARKNNQAGEKQSNV
jgi:hypothetical protein